MTVEMIVVIVTWDADVEVDSFRSRQVIDPIAYFTRKAIPCCHRSVRWTLWFQLASRTNIQEMRDVYWSLPWLPINTGSPAEKLFTRPSLFFGVVKTARK